jgi:hypothetical protein
MITFKVIRRAEYDELRTQHVIEAPFAADLLTTLLNVFGAHVREISETKVVLYAIESFGQHRAQWTIETDTIFEGSLDEIAALRSRIRPNQRPVRPIEVKRPPIRVAAD